MIFPATASAIVPGRRSRWRLWGRLLIAALAVLVALTIDLAPVLPPSAPPRAEQVEQARNTVLGVRDALMIGKGDPVIRMDGGELASAAALVNGLASFGRFDAKLGKSALHLRGSRRLLGPLWINIAADVPPSRQGMPAVTLKIGRLALGEPASRLLIGSVRHVLLWRGVRMPPLNDLVRGFAIDPAAVTARIHFPLDGALASDISALRKRPVDERLTIQIFCRLIGLDQRTPTNDMAAIVNRAFLPTRSMLDAVEQNRAAFVALAMYTASPSAGRLAGRAEALAMVCDRPHTLPLLLGRPDLPQHWSLSAALAVTLGDDIGKAMGEWKELADSRPNGSGFSFVDLSADRSGLATARVATDPARAAAIARRLRTVRADLLLPVRALALAEGLSEASFVSGFGDIDSKRFAEATARIDRVLAHTIGE